MDLHGIRLPILLMLAAFCVPQALALSTDKDQPIDIEADSVDIDEGRGTSVYRGNVTLNQGSMRLQADRVTVHHRGREATRFVAEGNPVRFRQLPDDGKEYNKARARRAEYEVDSEIITLIDDAELIHGKDTFASDRIVYDRVKATVRGGAAAEGKSRVKIRIQPRQQDADKP